MGEGQQAEEEQGGLKKGRNAERDHLLAPLEKAVVISSWNREHIQTAHGDLRQQDPASFDIGKENLNHTVPKGNDGEEQKQAGHGCVSRCEVVYQDFIA